MILVLISPRNAGPPFAQWLPEQSGRLVAVTAVGAAVGEGFAEVVTVPDYSDDDAVLDAARAAARRHRPRAIVALAEVDVERAAQLRSEFNLPDAVDFILNTHVGDEWDRARYTGRKSGDLLASWVITDTEGVSLSEKLGTTAAAVSAGFGWGDEFSGGVR